MLVRTRRFEKLRSCESWYSKVVEVFDGEDEVQKITDKYVKEIDDMAKKKEADIMEI